MGVAVVLEPEKAASAALPRRVLERLGGRAPMAAGGRPNPQ